MTSYYHTDHLGSSSVITNESGELVERTKYYPYGSRREGGEANKYYFTGQEFDRDTGLYYYGARYYHPVFATFTQADSIIPNPYDPQSLNRYAYTLNNPLKYVDPTGHDPNQAQMGSTSDVTKYNTFNDMVSFYGSMNNHNDLRKVAYVYSSEYGPIDLSHFSWGAGVSSISNGILNNKNSFLITKYGGEGVESLQKLLGPIQSHSANSYEDRTSNVLGAIYGIGWSNNLKSENPMTFEEFTVDFFNSIGVEDVTAEMIGEWQKDPSSAPDWFNELPQACDKKSQPPTSTSYPDTSELEEKYDIK
jgi:RHS repeat-associated protein